MVFFSIQLRHQGVGYRKCGDIVFPLPGKSAVTEHDYQLICDCRRRGQIGFFGGFLAGAIIFDKALGCKLPIPYRIAGVVGTGFGLGAYWSRRRMDTTELELRDDSKLPEFFYPEIHSTH